MHCEQKTCLHGDSTGSSNIQVQIQHINSKFTSPSGNRSISQPIFHGVLELGVILRLKIAEPNARFVSKLNILSWHLTRQGQVRMLSQTSLSAIFVLVPSLPFLTIKGYKTPKFRYRILVLIFISSGQTCRYVRK